MYKKNLHSWAQKYLSETKTGFIITVKSTAETNVTICFVYIISSGILVRTKSPSQHHPRTQPLLPPLQGLLAESALIVLYRCRGLTPTGN